MRITAQAYWTDTNSTNPVDSMRAAMTGTPLTAEWINDPRYDFPWANTTLLGTPAA